MVLVATVLKPEWLTKKAAMMDIAQHLPPRNSHAGHYLEVACCDCDRIILGNLNTKRCVECRVIWRKKYQKTRNAGRNNHARKVFRAVPISPKSVVTDRQVVAYLRAYMPDAYRTIIRKIEALLPDNALKRMLGE
jgi:hypothetical protein